MHIIYIPIHNIVHKYTHIYAYLYDLPPAYIAVLSQTVIRLKIIRLQTQRRLISYRSRGCISVMLNYSCRHVQSSFPTLL